MIGRRKNLSKLKLDIIKAFGADFDLEIKDSLFFVSENAKAVAYPVGQHIAIRDLFVKDDMRKNDIMFIYNDAEVEKMTSMNVSKDNCLLLVCEKRQKTACISVYKVNKLNFSSLSILKPKRKVVSSVYSEFTYASFSYDGNYIVCIGNVRDENTNLPSGILQGVIWDLQIFQPIRDDNYRPRCIFDLAPEVNKLTIENKILCSTGNNNLSFYYIYENNVKPFKNTVQNLNTTSNNFLDHDWISGKIPILIAITEKNDVYILEGDQDKKKKGIIVKEAEEDETNIRINKFVIRQHVVNSFGDFYINACLVRSFSKGIVVGSAQGHLLFLDRINQAEQMFRPIRYISREKQAKVVGLSFDNIESNLAIAFNSNEICTIDTSNIIENLNNENFEGVKFNLVCDGFHNGPITSMDIALQRPIIVTTSQVDKTIRVWNYLTGHCEFCKILLTEKDNEDKEIDVLAVAIHPNGYYIAVSDRDMIRFFHLCFKELRFYNNDVVNNESPKPTCHLLKFSYGGHLLAAVSNKTLYLLRSYTRETLKEIETPHTGTIKNIIFHEQDHYLYTIGSEGMVVEYSLFDFKIEKISSKYVSYSGGAIINFTDKTNIIACGFQSASKYVISEISIAQDSQRQVTLFMTQVGEKPYSVCQIRSKKYDILSIASGTMDGYVNLYPYPMDENYDGIPWETLKSHRDTITNILYCRDTNLIFTSGSDGNIFIYCVHESTDGENIAFEDNKLANLHQLTSMLDEGLGDNVLYPLQNIFNCEDKIKTLSDQLVDERSNKSSLISNHQTQMREVESKLNKHRVQEIKLLEEKIQIIQKSRDTTIDHYEEKIKQILNDKNQKLIENEQNYNVRIDQMSNTIHDLTSQIHYLKNQHELEMLHKDQEYEKKFKDLENELRKKFEELVNNNEKLNSELQQRQKMEELKFVHLDQEHEQEITYKIENFEKQLAKEKEEKHKYESEIINLKDQKSKLEQDISKYESNNKTLSQELERQNNQNGHLRTIIDRKEKDIEDFKLKYKKTDEELQEKSTLANFSNKLKISLYKKNNEIMSNYNRQQVDISDLKSTNKNIEKELEEAIRQIEEFEKELEKRQLLIDELKLKCEDERSKANRRENEIDNILQKIYNSFQTNDKNRIIEGISEIYKMYLGHIKKINVDSSKFNTNIRDELEKQIDFLQTNLAKVTEIKHKRDNIQIKSINNRTKENSDLIEMLNKNKTRTNELKEDNTKLRNENSNLKKQIILTQNEALKKEEKTKFPHIGQTQTDIINIFENNSSVMKVKKTGKLYKVNMLSKQLRAEKEVLDPDDLKRIIDEQKNNILRQQIEIRSLNNLLAKKAHTSSALNIQDSVI